MWRHQLVQLQFFKGRWVCGGVIGRRGRWKEGGPAEQLCCICATRPAEPKASGAISHREWSTNGDELWGDPLTPPPLCPHHHHPPPLQCTVPFDSAERCPDFRATQLIVRIILGCFWSASSFTSQKSWWPWNFLMLLNSINTDENSTCLCHSHIFRYFIYGYYHWWYSIVTDSPPDSKKSRISVFLLASSESTAHKKIH